MSGCVNDVAEGLPPVFVLVRVVLADVVLASAVAKGWFFILGARRCKASAFAR